MIGRFKRKSQTGFTLIELLIAIVILSLLVTVLLANYMGVQKRGRDSRRKEDLAQVQKGLEFYYGDKGRYPNANNGAIDGGAWGNSWSVSGEIYMAKVPKDPLNEGAYVYYYRVNVNGETTNQSYALYAKLENVNDPDVKNLGDYNYGVASTNVITIPAVGGGSPT